MSLTDKFRAVKKNLSNIAMAGMVSLAAGCASTYTAECFSTPETVKCSTITRFVPGDKIYYIPEAFAVGVIGTAIETDYHAKKSGCLSPITIPFSVTWGLVNTSLDTIINAACWIPLEVYEGITGKTWEGPYIPR